MEKKLTKNTDLEYTLLKKINEVEESINCEKAKTLEL